MSPQRGHVAPNEQSLLMWLTRRTNQGTRSVSKNGMSGIQISNDLEFLRMQGLHPMDLIHESALMQALDTKRVAHACLDVFNTEPQPDLNVLQHT